MREVNFDGMPFRDQVQHTIDADILFSIHGAGLTIPSTFGRHKSVVLEVMPYFTSHIMYRYKALASGITYMGYQCHKGTSQAGDSRYEQTSIPECMTKDKACKAHFLHVRKMDLVDSDISGIRELLNIARNFVMSTRTSVKAGKRFLKQVYMERCEIFQFNDDCRSSFIQSPLVGIHRTCVIEFECGHV